MKTTIHTSETQTPITRRRFRADASAAVGLNHGQADCHRAAQWLMSVLTALGLLLSCSAHAQFEALDQLAALNGDPYRAQRNALLDTHPSPWDVAAAAAHAWDAGLAARILNAWQINRSQYTDWDLAEPVETIVAGSFVGHPGTSQGPAATEFLLEQLWKTALLPDWFEGAFDGLMGLDLGGPPILWQVVWTNAPDVSLKSAALHGIAGDPSPGARQVLLGVLQDPAATNQFKHAALTGLAIARPPYATEVLQLTVTNGTFDASLTDDALAALAAQTGAAAHSMLYGLLLDTSQSDSLRQSVIEALGDAPQSGDVPSLNVLLHSAASSNLLARAARVLDSYAMADARPVLNPLLLPAALPDVSFWALHAFAVNGTMQDLPQIQPVAADTNRLDYVRSAATNAIASIVARDGP